MKIINSFSVRARLLLSLSVLFLVFNSCNKDESVEPQEDFEPINIYEVEYQDNAVEILRDDVAASVDLDASEPQNGSYVFQNPGSSLQDVKAGDVALLRGLDLVKVISVDAQVETLTWKTEPAIITDLIKDGEIHYKGKVSMDPLMTKSSSGISDSPIVIGDNSVTFNNTVSGVNLSYTLGRETGKTTFKGSAKSSSGGVTTLNVACDGYIKDFVAEYNEIIVNGKVTYRYFVLFDLDAEMKVTFGGVQASYSVTKVKLPAEMRIHVPIGILPTWISIGGSIEFETILSANSSAIGRGTFKCSGSMGFKEASGDLTLMGEDFKAEKAFESDEFVSTVQAGMGVVAEFPKLSLGIGQSVFEACAYVTMKNECVLNFTPHYTTAGPYPVIDGHCYKGSINTGFYCGASAKLLGMLELSTEQQLYGNTLEAFKTGDFCED